MMEDDLEVDTVVKVVALKFLLRVLPLWRWPCRDLVLPRKDCRLVLVDEFGGRPV